MLVVDGPFANFNGLEVLDLADPDLVEAAPAQSRLEVVFEDRLLVGLGGRFGVAAITGYWYFDCVTATGTACVHPLGVGLAIAIELYVLCAVILVRGQLLESKPSRGRWIAYFVAATLAVVPGSGFFREVMHDVGIWFDSHGRYGCNFSPNDYILTDSVLTLLLFVAPPLLIATLIGGGRLIQKKGSVA